MAECNSTECIYPNLSVALLNAVSLSETLLSIPLCNQQQFRLNKINEIKDYFVAEIKER